MPDVIMPDDKNAIRSQIFCKRLIPFNILCHAMYDLQDGPALPCFRDPARSMNRCAPVFGHKGKIYFHFFSGKYSLSVNPSCHVCAE
jgi:hypothetical protein